MRHPVLLALLLTSLALPAAAQTAAAPARPAAAAAAATDAAPAKDDDDDDDDAAPVAAAPKAEAKADDDAHEGAGKFDYGFSGILARDNRTDLAPLTLASGQPVATAEYTLKSGAYYRIPIRADGSAELALSGGDFWRAVWVNEIVVNDVEIRPMGVHSIEFDSAGEARVSFVAIVPGRYTLTIPGSSGDTQKAVFVIQ